MLRRIAPLLLEGFTAGLVFLGVGWATGAQAAIPGADHLVLAVGSTMPNLDPHDVVGFPPKAVHIALFDTLTRFNNKMELEPALATSWHLVNDTTWEFKLRPGVKFNTGEEFDANAVKFTIERLIRVNREARSRNDSVVRAESVDPLTVRIFTKAPDPLLLRNLTVMYIVPPKYIAQVGDAGFVRQPVGTGAYRFKQYQSGSFVELEAAPNSWRGSPRLKHITIREITDAAVRTAALSTGEVDIAWNVPVDSVDSLRQAGFDIPNARLARTFALILDPIRDTPVRDRRVRQAIAYAIDKEGIVKNIMRGFGRVPDGQLVGPDAFGYHPSLKAYAYDPAKAKQLLREAGFPNGFTTTMATTAGVNPNDKQIGEALAGYLSQVGMTVEHKIVEFALYIDYVFKPTGRPPLFLYGPDYYPAMDPNFQILFFASSHQTQRYNNPRFDELFAQSRKEMDAKKRQELLYRIAELMHEDLPVLPLVHMPLILGMNKRVQGFVPRPDQAIWYDAMSKAR